GTTTSTVTGFHDSMGDIYTETPTNAGVVSGKIYSCTNSTTGPTSAGVNAPACAVATLARLEAQATYLALVARPVGGASPAPGANLAGVTLQPGTYVAPGGAFLIQGGDLTLDAQGDANAIWVFQMASTLTVGGPGAAFPQSIILAGGAQAKNVFWQVGSFATINAAGGGTMVGTLISQEGMAFSTAGNSTVTTLNGRALSLGASVTLVNTVINVPQ
ncbi:MAG: ice-binding family protein, partial [Burkholderiaceae bacterium]|nr:ice-binding family protein [Burkholderiaceae bacterium]